jgi:hypothetical protein
MGASTIFSVANTTALLVWIALVVGQRRTWVTHGLVPIASALLSLTYVVIIATRFWSAPGGFSSLAAVSMLFSNNWLLLGGWLHYLAFDLLVGRWEAVDARERGITPWLVAPCLLLTFMFGPAGWLLYCGVRRAAV